MEEVASKRLQRLVLLQNDFDAEKLNPSLTKLHFCAVGVLEKRRTNNQAFSVEKPAGITQKNYCKKVMIKINFVLLWPV